VVIVLKEKMMIEIGTQACESRIAFTNWMLQNKTNSLGGSRYLYSFVVQSAVIDRGEDVQILALGHANKSHE
jgi:hypothetical protein